MKSALYFQYKASFHTNTRLPHHLPERKILGHPGPPAWAHVSAAPRWQLRGGQPRSRTQTRLQPVRMTGAKRGACPSFPGASLGGALRKDSDRALDNVMCKPSEPADGATLGSSERRRRASEAECRPCLLARPRRACVAIGVLPRRRGRLPSPFRSLSFLSRALSPHYFIAVGKCESVVHLASLSGF